MKQILSISLILILFVSNTQAQSADPVVISINGKSIYLSEFKAAYEKNDLPDNEKNIKLFLESYIDSKLNVEEALAQRLDTTSGYRYQYDSYRIQAINPYLKEGDYMTGYFDEMYSRSLENIKLNHVLVPFDKVEVFPSDTLKAYNEALKVYDKLKENGFAGDDFSDHAISREVMMDIDSKNGNLGWITPFMLSTPVENAAYAIPAGDISMPIRSSKGYHLIQVTAKRADAGYRTLDQVLFNFPHVPPTQRDIDSVMAVVEPLYKDMQAHSGFQMLCDGFAQAYGRDADQGCSFGEIALDTKLSASFINGAFDLQNIGDVSLPVVSNYGVHILRLVSKRMPSQEEVKGKMMEKMRSGDKGFYYTSDFQNYLFKKYGLVVNASAYRQLTDIANRIYPTDSTFVGHVNNRNDVLFAIEDTVKYTVDGFADYLKDQDPQDAKNSEAIISQLFGAAPSNPFSLSVDRLGYFFNLYAATILRNYLKDTMDKKNVEIGRLVDEYAEGILIFDVKNRNVWRKAQMDDAGLARFFEKNKSKYKWSSPRYKGFVVTCSSKEVLEKATLIAKKSNKKGDLKKNLQDALGADVTVREGLWSKGQNKYVDHKVFSDAEPLSESADPFYFVTGKLIKAPQNMDDVKGEVVSDYQDELEKEWTSSLRRKYNVKVDETVIKKIEE